MYQYNCKIVRVVDGDTLDVDIDLGFDIFLQKKRIRLQGLDTPEKRSKDSLEKVFGNLASEKVKEYLRRDISYKLTTYKDKVGKFGRILGDIEIYDENLDIYAGLVETLIKYRYGVSYKGQDKLDIKHAHLKNYQFLLTCSNNHPEFVELRERVQYELDLDQTGMVKLVESLGV